MHVHTQAHASVAATCGHAAAPHLLQHGVQCCVGRLEVCCIRHTRLCHKLVSQLKAALTVQVLGNDLAREGGRAGGDIGEMRVQEWMWPSR